MGNIKIEPFVMAMQEILAEFLLACVPDLLDRMAEISWICYICTNTPKMRSVKEVSRVEVSLSVSLLSKYATSHLI
jgi:hypothetical protein